MKSDLYSPQICILRYWVWPNKPYWFLILIFPIPLTLLWVMLSILTFPPSVSLKSKNTFMSCVIWNEHPKSIIHSYLASCPLVVTTRSSLNCDTTFTSSLCLLSWHSLPMPFISTNKTTFVVLIKRRLWLKLLLIDLPFQCLELPFPLFDLLFSLPRELTYKPFKVCLLPLSTA